MMIFVPPQKFLGELTEDIPPLFFLDRSCQMKTKIKMDSIILKIMVFPQSGGENRGGKFRRGKSKIKKNPIK